MQKLPVISGDQCISALQKLGYTISRIRGSHVWLVCPGRNPVPVPRHRQLGKGILRKIIHMIDMDIEDFIKLLK